MKDKNKEKGDKGVRIVKEYLEKKGYHIQNVTKNKEESYKGCDLVGNRGEELIKIEVKTTHSKHGVPDFHINEFDDNLKLKADFLYIVRLKENDRVDKLEILSKEEVDRYADNHKVVERVRTIRLDTDLKNKKIGKPVNGDEL